MKRNFLLLIVIMLLFLFFYSAYYYYSLNMQDKLVRAGDEKNTKILFSMQHVPDENENTLVFPLMDMTFPDTDTLHGDPGEIYRAYLQTVRSNDFYNVFELVQDPENEKNSEIFEGIKSFPRVTEDVTVMSFSLRTDLLFKDNFYVKNEEGIFAGYAVRMLIGRPGHRGRAASLYRPDDGPIKKMVHIPVPGEDVSILLVSTDELLAFRELYRFVDSLRNNDEGIALAGNHRLQFPLMHFRTLPVMNFFEHREEAYDSLAIFYSQIRISAAQHDVSLLPSRRFPGGDSEDDDHVFNEPFYMFLIGENEKLPIMAAFFSDAQLFNQLNY